MNEKVESHEAHCRALSICICWLHCVFIACIWTICSATLTCLELQGVHCAACWLVHRELPVEGRCPEGSREGEGSGDSEGDGSGCMAPCCCYPLMSLMTRCQRRCAPHLNWRCGWQRLGSQHIPSLLPASPETPASWPVFCDKHIEDEKCFFFICESSGKLTIILSTSKIQNNFLTGKKKILKSLEMFGDEDIIHQTVTNYIKHDYISDNQSDKW